MSSVSERLASENNIYDVNKQCSARNIQSWPQWKRFLECGNIKPCYIASHTGCASLDLRNLLAPFLTEKIDTELLESFGCDSCAVLRDKLTSHVVAAGSESSLAPLAHADLPLAILAFFDAHSKAFTLLDNSDRMLTYIRLFSLSCRASPDSARNRRGITSSLQRNISYFYGISKSLDLKSEDKQSGVVAISRIADVLATRNRSGWSHKDVLKLCHLPSSYSNGSGVLVKIQFDGLKVALEKFKLASEAKPDPEKPGGNLDVWSVEERGANEAILKLMQAVQTLRTSSNTDEVVKTLKENPELGIDHLPTHWIKNKSVWKAIVPSMKLTQLLRWLPSLTINRTLEANSDLMMLVLEQLKGEERVMESRIGPAEVLFAWKYYEHWKGRIGKVHARAQVDAAAGNRPVGPHPGPLAEVVDALTYTYSLSFKNLTPIVEAKWMVMVDGSVCPGQRAGYTAPHLVPPYSAVLAKYAAGCLVQCALRGCGKAENSTIVTTWGDDGEVKPLEVVPKHTFDEILHRLMGSAASTEPWLAIKWAMESKREADVFLWIGDVADSMTLQTVYDRWAGELEKYKTGMARPNAKVVLVYLCANHLKDINQTSSDILLVGGYDLAVPGLIWRFVRGDF